MNLENTKQPGGSLKISQDVIATIAGYAASEIEGVVALSESRLPIKNMLKKGGMLKPIQINLNDDVAIIDMSVDLRFGTRIPDVAETLQKTVKDAVQSMTGITVSKVNIHVEGIVFPQPPAAEQE